MPSLSLYFIISLALYNAISLPSFSLTIKHEDQLQSFHPVIIPQIINGDHLYQKLSRQRTRSTPSTHRLPACLPVCLSLYTRP